MSKTEKEAAPLPVRSNAGLGDAETLIANLYRARQMAKEEKRVWRERAAELECENDGTEDGTRPCYYMYRYPEDAELWCDNCKSKTAHRKTYHAASAAAGAALNAVLRAGKKLASPNKKSLRNMTEADFVQAHG